MPFIELAVALLGLYKAIVIISVILSWLLMLNIINIRHPVMDAIYRFCYSLTEPGLRLIRRRMSPINGIDLSPIVLLFAIWLAQRCLMYYVAPIFLRSGL